MEKAVRSHLDLQKFGGGAALYLAAAYLAAIPYFLLVVDYRSAADPAARLALVASHQGSMYAMTLVTYVIFGLALAVLAIALRDRFTGDGSPLARLSAGLGLVWAGLLIASGSVFTMGMENALALRAADPAGAASAWGIIESVADGLGGGCGEAVGGPWVVLVSWAGLRSKRLPAVLCWVGVAVGLVGVASIIPALRDAAIGFGILQIPWLAWLGIALLRTRESTGAA
jgi:hypothetical protein